MSKLTCLVCLQKFPHLQDDNLTSSYQPRLLSSPLTCSEKNLYTRFLHFCTRHLKLTSLPLNGRENEVFCPKCKCLVNCLCDLWHEMEVVKLHLVWKLNELGEMFKVLGKNSKAEKDIIKQLELDSIRVKRFRAEVKEICVKRIDCTPKVVVSNRIIPEMWKFSHSETKSTLARLIFVFALAFDKETSKERNFNQPKVKKEENDLPDAENYSGGEEFNEFTNDKDSDWSNAASPPRLDSDTEFIPDKPKKRGITRKRKIKMDKSQPMKRSKSRPRRAPKTLPQRTRGPYKTPKPRLKTPDATCKICGDKLNTLSDLETHMISTHETDEKSHSCWFCSESFSLKETRLVHRWNGRKHPIRKMFTCDHVNCHESFYCPDKHEEHLQSHLESTPPAQSDSEMKQEPSKAIHHCAKCNLGFFHQDHLDFHELNHLDINLNTFNCPKCTSSFNEKKLLLVHYKPSHLYHLLRRKLPSIDNNFKCDKCDYLSPDEVGLKRHLKMHKEKEPLECDQCGVICHGRVAKLMHLKTEHQQNVEEYPCPECGRSFVSQTEVSRHMRNVHCAKKYFCDICGAGFKHNCNLKDHKDRYHDPNRTKQHICSVCGKAYFSREGLRFHVNSVHVAEEEKGFGCPYCQKRFHRENLAKGHVKTCMKQKGLEVPDDDKIEVEWSAAAVEEKLNKGRRRGKLISGRIVKKSGDGSKSFDKFLY